MRTDHSIVIAAVRAAQRVLAKALNPANPCSERETISKLSDILDDEGFNRAVDRMEKREGLRKSV